MPRPPRKTAASADPGADAGDEDAADPADTTANTDPLTAQIKAWNEKRTEMGGTVPTGMAAVAFDTSVTTAQEQNQMSTLVCVGEGWLDVHPHFLTDGWLFTQTDYEKGNRVAVLDEKLAFQLFPTDEPVGRSAARSGKTGTPLSAWCGRTQAPATPTPIRAESIFL